MPGDASLDRRVAMAHLPTPLEPLELVGRHLGLAPGALWVERDDMTEIVWASQRSVAMDHQGIERAIEDTCRQVAADGRRPFSMPIGGATAVGAAMAGLHTGGLPALFAGGGPAWLRGEVPAVLSD